MVGPAQRLDDGSAICRVRIPFKHPTEVLTLTDADGHAFQVDYDITYRAGPGRTVVRRRDGTGGDTAERRRSLRSTRCTPVPTPGGQHRNERPAMECAQAVGVRFDVE